MCCVGCGHVLCTSGSKHVEHGSSVVDCRTRNRESSGSNHPFGTVSKFGHFRSLHNTLSPVHTSDAERQRLNTARHACRRR